MPTKEEYQKTKEYYKKYYLKNREKLLEYKRKYNIEHKRKCKRCGESCWGRLCRKCYGKGKHGTLSTFNSQRRYKAKNK